jgi:hypothetical protein
MTRRSQVQILPPLPRAMRDRSPISARTRSLSSNRVRARSMSPSWLAATPKLFNTVPRANDLPLAWHDPRLFEDRKGLVEAIVTQREREVT